MPTREWRAKHGREARSAATESVYYVSGSDVYHVRADCVALYGRLSTPRWAGGLTAQRIRSGRRPCGRCAKEKS